MKKILSLVGLIAISLGMYAAEHEEECTLVNNDVSDYNSTIEHWGQDYVPCTAYTYHVNFPEDWSAVEIDYVVDLNPLESTDILEIYMVDENNTEVERLGYSFQPTTGTMTVPLHYNKMARIVFISRFGNAGGLYRGFKLAFSESSETSTDQVFNSNVGIGIQPQERLHVNGAIRGDGESGSLRIRTTAGTTEIGAANSVYSHFYTDRSAFFFNKPLHLAGGTISAYGTPNSLTFQTQDTDRMVIHADGEVEMLGDIYVWGAINGSHTYNQAVRIRSDYGYADMGAVNAGYFHFYTDRPGFYFSKALTINGGKIRSASGNNLYLNTFNQTRMTILQSNGNVGIGKLTPAYKLDVAGTIRADSIIADGLIRAEEIIVETSGADFVFAEDYQLRPLSEVKAFIQENKHLPEIKSAQEMQENGVGINELQTQLLQKIEELTLYILQQEERIKVLEELLMH